MWQLFQQNPSRQQEVADLIGLLVDAQQDTEAVALARKLEQFQRNKGDRRAFVAMLQEVVAKHRGSPDLLEFMSELFNASNREGDYCQTLLKLFDLHCGMGNYAKAAECLDRAADVDAYEPGHQKRLEMLRGKIDDGSLQSDRVALYQHGEDGVGTGQDRRADAGRRCLAGPYAAGRNPGAVRNALQGD